MSRTKTADFRWYLIRTARFLESYVSTELRRLGGAEVYEPLARAPVGHAGHGNARIEPLFPGYVFARLNLATQLPALRRVCAFGSLVSVDGHPAIVDGDVIREMRRLERGRGYIELKTRKQERAGSASAVADRFLQHPDGMQRASVLIEMLIGGAAVSAAAASV